MGISVNVKICGMTDVFLYLSRSDLEVSYYWDFIVSNLMTHHTLGEIIEQSEGIETLEQLTVILHRGRPQEIIYLRHSSLKYTG